MSVNVNKSSKHLLVFENLYYELSMRYQNIISIDYFMNAQSNSRVHVSACIDSSGIIVLGQKNFAKIVDKKGIHVQIGQIVYKGISMHSKFY